MYMTSKVLETKCISIQSAGYSIFPPRGTATLSTWAFFHTKLSLLWKRDMIERPARIPKVYTCWKTNSLHSWFALLFTLFPPTSAPCSKSSPMCPEQPREQKWIQWQQWGVSQFIRDAKGREMQFCFFLPCLVDLKRQDVTWDRAKQGINQEERNKD